MPDKRKQNGEGKNETEQVTIRPRPFWSGTIAFGLVSLPVSLFPANRGRSVSLKMVDASGTPLKRRYFCEKEQKALERDDIVRGYEIEKGRYVVVKDEELESLAPEKSREIDLRRFVSLADINPVFFERAYFLTPDEGATKAYRLLAKSMEDEARAGIATFVMRGKEYLVAILAENGILRAETLRFHDEVRTPDDVGLPSLDAPPASLVAGMEKAIKKMSTKKFDSDELRDDYAKRLEMLVKKKLKAGKDVIKAPEEVMEEYEEETNVIDLMQVLKERLQGRSPEPPTSPARETGHGRTSKRRKNKGKHPTRTLAEYSKNELYERAQSLEISGRSRMSKHELIQEIEKRE